jgi:hypothetical protein
MHIYMTRTLFWIGRYIAKPGQCSRDVYVNESSCQYCIKMYCPTQDKCSGHVYVNEVSCHYSIKMYVPSQDSVRVMDMCIRVPASILLRCMFQSRTVFDSCICV